MPMDPNDLFIASDLQRLSITDSDARRLGESVPDDAGAAEPVWHERLTDTKRQVLVNRRGNQVSIREVIRV